MLPSLVYWRLQSGFTEGQLAKRIGMNLNTVQRVEAGYPARVRTARLLARALDVQVADLSAPTGMFP
jgi:transcriptional regulator with XRE-family HTH domain